MSGGVPCSCAVKDKSKWQVIQRNCNHSAFNGYRRTRSDYSSVTCTVCGHVWRTKAAYVMDLVDWKGVLAERATPPEQPQAWPGLTLRGGRS